MDDHYFALFDIKYNSRYKSIEDHLYKLAKVFKREYLEYALEVALDKAVEKIKDEAEIADDGQRSCTSD